MEEKAEFISRKTNLKNKENKISHALANSLA